MTVKAKKVGPKGYPNGGYPRRLSDGESHFAQCPLRGDHFETDTSLNARFATVTSLNDYIDSSQQDTSHKKE